MGGFHLEWATAGKVERIIAAFKSHGVRYVAPTHCSGERARHLFQQHYGQGCISAGVGRTISLADLRDLILRRPFCSPSDRVKLLGLRLAARLLP